MCVFFCVLHFSHTHNSLFVVAMDHRTLRDIKRDNKSLRAYGIDGNTRLCVKTPHHREHSSFIVNRRLKFDGETIFGALGKCYDDMAPKSSSLRTGRVISKIYRAKDLIYDMKCGAFIDERPLLIKKIVDRVRNNKLLLKRKNRKFRKSLVSSGYND